MLRGGERDESGIAVMATLVRPSLGAGVARGDEHLADPWRLRVFSQRVLASARTDDEYVHRRAGRQCNA
jgi:hypothetical protein